MENHNFLCIGSEKNINGPKVRKSAKSATTHVSMLEAANMTAYAA